MTERRRGLGRGLGALIPTEPAMGSVARPRDVFFRDQSPAGDRATASGGTDREARSPETASYRPLTGQVPVMTGSAAAADTIEHHESDAASASTPETTPGTTAEETVTTEAPADSESDTILPVPGASFALLPLDAIRPNARQPRQVFDEDELAELVHSIKEIGMLQPVVVRPVAGHADPADPAGSDDDVAYELVMGERRWRASREAGETTIPAIIRSTGDDDMLRDALLENLHRTQLNPLEEAAAYQQLLDDFGCTHEELASKLGRSRPQISNFIRLLKLPPLVQRRVAAGVLSAGHARALLALPDAAAMERLAQRIVAEGLSVRSVEEIVALGGEPERPARRAQRGDARMPELDDLAAFLADRWDTRVSIAMGRRKGRMTVEFASVDDLNRILEAIGERPRRVDGDHQLAG